MEMDECMSSAPAYLVHVATAVDGGHGDLRRVQLDLAHDLAHHVGEHVALALREQILGDLRTDGRCMRVIITNLDMSASFFANYCSLRIEKTIWRSN